MTTDLTIKIILTLIFGFGAYILPDLAFKFACYKRTKKGKELPKRKVETTWKVISVVLNTICIGVVMYFLPIWQAIICIPLFYIVMFGSVVDVLIRIVANEMLMVMLPVGLIYRVMDGGFISLLGSLGAFIIVVVVFGGAMFITRKLKGANGVGMGDVKLAMVIGLTVGWPGVSYFLIGMAISMAVYSVVGLKTHTMTLDTTFPMCGFIMAGLVIALIMPLISPYIIELVGVLI